jgi:hypothetical protein
MADHHLPVRGHAVLCLEGPFRDREDGAMDALTALKSEAEQYRWNMITVEACKAKASRQRWTWAGIITGIAFLCVAMSDGEWFPWLNFLALGGLAALIEQGKRRGVL